MYYRSDSNTVFFDSVIYIIFIVYNIPLNRGYQNGRFIVEIRFMCCFLFLHPITTADSFKTLGTYVFMSPSYPRRYYQKIKYYTRRSGDRSLLFSILLQVIFYIGTIDGCKFIQKIVLSHRITYVCRETF